MSLDIIHQYIDRKMLCKPQYPQHDQLAPIEHSESGNVILDVFQRPGIYLQQIQAKNLLKQWRRTEYINYISKQRRETCSGGESSTDGINSQLEELHKKTAAIQILTQFDIESMRNDLQTQKKALYKKHMAHKQIKITEISYSPRKAPSK